jgi:hypothetical protein
MPNPNPQDARTYNPAPTLGKVDPQTNGGRRRHFQGLATRKVCCQLRGFGTKTGLFLGPLLLMTDSAGRAVVIGSVCRSGPTRSPRFQARATTEIETGPQFACVLSASKVLLPAGGSQTLKQ